MHFNIIYLVLRDGSKGLIARKIIGKSSITMLLYSSLRFNFLSQLSVYNNKHLPTLLGPVKGITTRSFLIYIGISNRLKLLWSYSMLFVMAILI